MQTLLIVGCGDVARRTLPHLLGRYRIVALLREAPELHPVPQAMLHHLYGRLSERVVYGGYWQDVTCAIVRHKDLTQ